MRTGLTNLKRIVAILVIFCLMLSLIPANAFAVEASDISGHWAQVTIQSWMDKGLIKGYGDGTFRPDNNISRAEFITLVNGAFGYTAKATINYTDVQADAWYTNAIAIAKAAGYISGYPDNTMKPGSPISREEAASIMMKINKLEANGLAPNKFSDASILSWSKDAVGAVASANIMNGYPDGSFKPRNFIKRGEAVVALDKALTYSKNNLTYSTAGTYGPATGVSEVAGNVIVAEKGTVLQNMVIKGNLTIRKNVGEGDVTLKNVTVKGETMIYGGGQNSIIIINSTLGKVTVSKENGKIRIVISGSTTVAEVLANSGVKLEESNLTGNSAGFQKVIIDASIDDVIILMGSFTEVDVESAGLEVQIPQGTTVNTLVLDEKTTVTGTGTVTNADINTSGSTFETAPITMDVANGVTAPVVSGGSVPPPPVVSGGSVPPLTVVNPITRATVAVTQGSIDFSFSFWSGSTPITFAQAQADLYCLDTIYSTVQLRAGSNDLSSQVKLSDLPISDAGKLSYATFGSMVAAFGNFQNIPTDIRLSLSCGVDPTVSNPWTYDTGWLPFSSEEQNIFALYAAAADLAAAKAAEALLTSTDYVDYTAVTAALALPETTNAEIVAKTTAINAAIAGLVTVVNAAASVTTMAQLQAALTAGVKDITITSGLTADTSTVTIPSGTTLRGYWLIGEGNKIVVEDGGLLRWSAANTGNLLVGADSNAYLELAFGATFTITGGASGIASYELTGTGTVNQQNGEPFVVEAGQTFTIADGATLEVGASLYTSDNPVLSIHSDGGMLAVNGTLDLLANSRVVLGAGLTSITGTGTVINNNAGTQTNGNGIRFGLIDGVNQYVSYTLPTLSQTSVSDVTDTTATLNFTSNEAGTYYYLVYRAAKGAPTTTQIKNQGTAAAKGTAEALVTANTASVTSLTASTKYKAYVIVKDAAGNYSDISTIAVTTTAAPDVTAPGLSAESASAITDTTATLNFTSDEAGTYYYLVYAFADPAPNAATIEAQGTAVAEGTAAAIAAANTASVTGMTASTAYNAYVIVVDAATNASLVSTIAVTTTAAPTTYTVTFDSKDGSTVAPIADIVSGDTVTLPDAPTKDGFTFAGWFSDDTTFAVPFTGSTPVIDNITVYAKWTADVLAAGTAAAAAGTTTITYTLTTGTFDATAGIVTGNWTLAGTDFAELGAITGVVLSRSNMVATITVTNAIVDAHNYTVAPAQAAFAVGFTAPAAVTVTVAYVAPSTVYVDAAYSSGSAGGHVFGYDAFTTIQAGITAAVTGGTVNVAAGTYTEVGQIVISKDLTIVGASMSTTIIKPSTDTGASGNAKGWWLVDQGKVFNLSEVTLNGTGKMIFHGIRDMGTGTIQSVHFTDITYNASGPDYAGFAIYAFGMCGAVDVSNCVFDNIGREGIAYWGPGTTGTYTGNTYTGKGSGDWLDYGVEANNGAVVTITNSTITNNLGVTSDGSNSAGVAVLTVAGPGTTVTITGSTFTGNSLGIGIGWDSADTSVVHAHGNTISGNTISGAENIGSTAVFDATYNWWGDASGPGVVGSGTGDKVSTNVSFEPWYTDAGMTIPSAPTGLAGVAPTVLGVGDGQITGTTTAMEYKLSSAGSYTATSGTSITGLAAGTYNVRYAAKTGYNAGTATDVVVAAGVLTVTDTPVITGTVRAGDTSVSGTAEAGASVVLTLNSGTPQAPVTATGGAWTVSGLTLATGDVISVTALTSGKTISAAATTTVVAYVAPSTVYVDAAYSSGSAGGHVFGYDAFTTIQAGITAAVTGGTVNVAAGTYYEDIQINKSLTIDGARPDLTILDGHSATENYYMVSIEADNVTVKDLAITNPLYTGAVDASGIITTNGSPARKSNLHITNVKIHDIGTPTRVTSNGTQGINIGPVNGLEIDHSEIYNIIDNNTDSAAFGITVWGDDSPGTADNINIHDNVIHDITNPVWADGIYANYHTANITINHNTVTGPFTRAGIKTDAYMMDGSATITNNTVTGASAYGILLRSPYAQTVTGNTISGATVGIQVNATSTVAPTINSNSISGNTTGLNNLSSNVVDATHNWWGNATGPAHTSNPGGTGDPVSDNVSFNPWYTNAGMTTLSTPSSDASLSGGTLGGVSLTPDTSSSWEGSSGIGSSSGLCVTVPAGSNALEFTKGNPASVITYALTVSTGGFQGSTPTPVDADYTHPYVPGGTSITITNNNDRIWLRVTAQDGTKLYYWIIVTVTAGPTAITAATIAIAAPATGGTPAATIATGTGYTGTISWTSPASGNFVAGTPAATVVLTAGSGYTFTGMAATGAVTIAGSTSATYGVSGTNGETLTITVGYAALA